jgi:hypothetical protein
LQERVGPAAVAFVLAAAISLSELLTTQYPRTSFLILRRSRALYTYALAYGVIALVVMLLLETLTDSKVIQLEGFGLSSPWIRAIAVGVTVKAFLHLRLFNVSVGSQSVPVGLETLVQFFEPALLRTILLDEFTAVRAYVAMRALGYPSLEAVKTRAKEEIPPTLPNQERAAFSNDIDRATSVVQVMEHVLRFLGRKNLDRVFPAKT